MSEQNDETADGCEMLTATSDPVVIYQALCGATDEIEQLKRERDEAQATLTDIHRWIERNHPDGFIDSLSFHQNLERVADRWYDRLDYDRLDIVERERDEAREQIRELIYISERAIALAEIDLENDKFGVTELRDALAGIKEGGK